jgi:hypothetical protein
MVTLEDLKNDGMLLEKVANPTEEEMLTALKQNGFALKYIPAEKQTKKICKTALKTDGLALEYVANKTEELYLYAVKQDGFAIIYAQDSSNLEELQKLAVSNDGFAITLIDNPSFDIIKLALKNNAGVAKWIKSINSLTESGDPVKVALAESMIKSICEQ